MDAVIGGVGTISTASITCTMNMLAVITVNSVSPTPTELAREVWATPLPGAYTGSKAGKIVGSKLLTVIKFLGLK